MAGQWDFLSFFENDADEILQVMKTKLNDFSKNDFKLIASIADEKGEPAKGVIFYNKVDNKGIVLNNSSWAVYTVTTDASGRNQEAYKTDLFEPIKSKLNELDVKSAFAAKVFLTDCADGTATATLCYPRTWTSGTTEPIGIWGYSYYFNRNLSSVIGNTNSQINLNVPNFSLAAVADEDDNDAKSVIFMKSGLHTDKLYRGKDWKFYSYKTEADGSNVNAYCTELFDKIKSDLSTLTDAQIFASQLFFTDRSGGKARISIFYPDFPLVD